MIGRLGTRGHPNQMSQAVNRANVQHTRTEAVEVYERPDGHEVPRVGSERLLHRLLAGDTRPRPSSTSVSKYLRTGVLDADEEQAFATGR